MAQAAAQFEDLALGGFECLPQLVDLVPVPCLSALSWAVRVRTTLLGVSSWVVVAAGGGVFCCWARRCSTRWRIGVQR